MDDLPHVTLHIAEGPPIAQFERLSNDGEEQPSIPLNLTPDVRLVTGGSYYMPGASGVLAGEPPAPWNSPVNHAERLLDLAIAEAIRARPGT